LYKPHGGTEKTTVIGAITDTFRYYGKLDILAKCATTGIAAVGIGASTLHSWAGIPPRVPKDDEEWLNRSTKPSVEKRRANIDSIILVRDNGEDPSIGREST